MRNEIIEMARACGINFHQAGWPELERFFHIAQEYEREACAQVCDEMAAQDKTSNYYAVAARAIRSRSDK